MADNYVLVPMQLDVMVLNQAADDTTPFNRTPTAYGNLLGFTDPEPPFPYGGTRPTLGIYLHWTLPKGIREGQYNDDGTTDFPFAPNRWLVVRVWASPIASTEAVKAWFLESDFLDDSAGTSPFIDPTTLSSGLPIPTKIGRATRFNSDFTTPPSPPSPFLKAVGPGSVTFAQFAPNVQNVFAYTDDVTETDDTTPIPKGNFTYYVVGWYSDQNIDPLNGTTWQASADIAGAFANDQFDWYVFADSNNIPTSTLVHALVSDVVWDAGAENATPQDYPTSNPTAPNNIQNNVKVAIGNTAVDALSALVRLYASSDDPAAAGPSPGAADLLEAFQYGLLNQFDQPGSSEALNMAIRRHWYGASSGGTVWQIVPLQQTGNTALPATPAPALTTQQAKLLAKLNSEQARLDRQQRIQESMQWNLHALWWKANWLSQNSLTFDPNQWFLKQLNAQLGTGVTCKDPNGIHPSEEDWYYCKVQAQNNLVASLVSGVEAIQTELNGLIDANSQMLRSANLPHYYYPNDPVLLVTGLGRATNFDPPGNLLCRLPSQTINTMTVAGTTYSASGSSGTEIQSQIPTLSDPNSLLPDGIQELHTESFFLSPLLFSGDVSGGPTQAAVASAIAALPAPAADGQFPPVAFTMTTAGQITWEWEQPWVPLLLDWQIAVLQDPAETDHEFNQSNWSFNGTDFQWATPLDPAYLGEANSQMTLSGRTFITPSLIYTLADQLSEYVQQQQTRDPNLQGLLANLDGYIEQIQKQDFLSQRLSGLMAQMVQRSFVQTLAPVGSVAGLLSESIHGIPMPYPSAPGFVPTNDFAPLGGTFFVIQNLMVTDTFGRTIDLRLANNNADTAPTSSSQLEYYFYPIPGWNMQVLPATTSSPTLLPPQTEMSTNPTQRMLQLTPRAVQDSQLSFRLVSNDGKDSEITQAAGANPICGWIVPNHLDRSLALYAPDGTAWGELYLSLQNQTQYVPVWQPDPTNPQAPQSVSDIPNTYVQGMLQTLYARTDNGAAFSDFLQVIDETLWTINPQGQRKDQNLSVLIGRPLAIVRAQLSLKVRGLPYYNQDWWNTFANVSVEPPPPMTPPTFFPLATVDGGVVSGEPTPLLWPVRLGSQALRDDGLIGYYVDNPATPYQVFNTLTLPASIQTNYLSQIGGSDNNYLRLQFTDDTINPNPTPSQLSGVTMLVDPRGSVHAFTGLLPVTQVNIPSGFISSALKTMCYTFRSGPFLTSPDAVRIPRPRASQGTWTWFDKVLNTTVPLSHADEKTRIGDMPALIKEGWLKFTPNPARDSGDD